MSATLLDVEAIRRRYTSLQSGFAFFDAPGGTQVPDEVGEAIARTLREASANLGAPYETGQRVEAVLAEAKRNGAGFLGCTPDEVVFGMNMTTINFALSRTAGRDWQEGDEVIVTRLDHDGCAAPWVELAADKGMKVHLVDVHEDLTLDFDDLERKLSDRTRVVACSVACNAVGTLVDVERLCSLAREAGAISWLDAVHYAAHERIDVVALGCDVLICSPYKFCGPHLGLGFVRRELAETWRPYKARPAPTEPLARRFETGTLPYELLGGFNATLDYIADIGGMDAIREYERSLGQRFLDTLPESVTVYGLPTMEGRVPTFLVNVDGASAYDVAAALAEKRMGVWAHDGWYCVGLAERLPAEGSVRIGFIHYNTADEVDRLVAELGALGS
jgi:cysteine desulfurase family protein (TIGR01976 family)